MPAYPRPPTADAQLLDHERRLKAVEVQLASRARGATPPAPATVWDVNPIWNGDMEAGVTGYRTAWWRGTPNSPVVEAANPLAGERSLRVDEAADSSSRVYWNPSYKGDPPAAVVGTDVFATKQGDIWRASVLYRSSVALSGPTLGIAFGVAAADCYAILSASVSWATAASAPSTAMVPIILTGQVTCPAPGTNGAYNYCTVWLYPGDTTPGGQSYSWWADSLSIQKKLN